MANRYWRGGAGTWDTTTTTNWSATSGGAGGASVPTAADSVFFDQAGTYTVTMTGALTCLDFTNSAGTVTFATGTSPTLAVSGSMSLLAGAVWTSTGTITFNATTTGKTFTPPTASMACAITFNGVGGGWTLGRSLGCGTFTLTNGALDTNNFNIAASGSFTSNNSNTRSLTLGSSTISCSAWTITTTTGLTFSAGTSTITVAAVQGAFSGGGLTYNNVQLNPGGTYSGAVTGANTFANLTSYANTSQYSTNNSSIMTFAANQVVTGTLDFGTSAGPTYRKTVGATPIGTQITISAGAVAGSNVDIRDIAITGAAATFNASGLGWGDLGNNTGITFPTPKTVYWNLAGPQNWYSVGWATSSGGTPASANFPLAQDTAIFDNTGSAGTVTIPGYHIGNLDTSARTLAVTLATSTVIYLTGNTTLSSGVTLSGANTVNYFGKAGTPATLTGNGATITVTGITLGNNVNLSLGGALSMSGTLSLGTLSSLSTGSYSVSCSAFLTGVNGSVRTVDFGSSTFTCTGTGTVWNTSLTASLTVTGLPTVNVVSSGSTAITVAAGVLAEANAPNFNFTGGTYALTFLDLNQHGGTNIDFTGFAGTWLATSTARIYGNLTLSTGMTLTASASAMTFGGTTSGTRTITTNGKTIPFSITFNNNAGSYSLADALTVGTIYTTTIFSAIQFNLNGNTLTTGLVSMNTGGTINFGGGNITLTGSGTVFTGSANTQVTGTPNVYLTYSGAVATTIAPASPVEARTFNFIVTAGSYSLSISAGNIRNLDFSNGGTSTYTGVWAGSTTANSIYGNLTLNPSMTVTGTGVLTFASTSGIDTINTNGIVFPRPLTFNGVGGTWQLQGALTISSATAGAVTLTNGTLDLNGYTLTLSAAATATVLTTTGTKNLTFNGGTLAIAASGTTAFNNAGPSGFTTTAGTGTGTITLTSASAKTFVGGGSTFNCSLNQGGAGALTISGANTFSDITNTYSATGAATITLTAGVTQTVAAFSGSGAATRLLTLNSSTAGTQATLAYSSIGNITTGNYLSVKDIAFTPGPATDGTTPYRWYLGANSTNGGNNTGGLFQAGGVGALKVYQITNTSTTTWTVPSDWNSVSNTIHLIGAGGGGGGSRFTSTSNKAAGGGGGGGGYRVLTNYSTTGGSSIAIAIGTGGTAGASAGGTGGTGGTTSWAATNTATGGTGGSTTATPTSAGGTGGTGTFSGGAGGAGSTTTSTTSYTGGGGAGGAAGPNGNGGAGGNGFSATGTTTTAGGGGGGNGGGTNGGNASSATGGTGGNNSLGTGGGASNVAGTLGGGGGGGVVLAGPAGGPGIDILNTVGGGGGPGGAGIVASTAAAGTTGALYGSGGSGASGSSSGPVAAGGAGAQGLIVIAYVPAAATAASVTESSTASDLISARMIRRPSVAETATGTDAISTRASMRSVIADAATAADSISGGLRLQSQVADTATGTDTTAARTTIRPAITETATGSDALTTRMAYFSTVSNTAAGSDTVTARKTLYVSVADSATATDIVQTIRTYLADISETATASEALAAHVRFVSRVNELASGTDVVAASRILATVVSETATASDVASALGVFNTALAEGATALDAAIARGIQNVTVVNTASGTDSLTAGATMSVSFADQISAADAFLAAYLWNLIDDSQTPDWGDIANTQTAGWAQIPNPQTSGWTDTSNTQTANWDDVDDNQTPGWQNINTS